MPCPEIYTDAMGDLMTMSGNTVIAAEYGAAAGIADLDGKQPRSYRDTMGAPHIFPQGAR